MSFIAEVKSDFEAENWSGRFFSQTQQWSKWGVTAHNVYCWFSLLISVLSKSLFQFWGMIWNGFNGSSVKINSIFVSLPSPAYHGRVKHPRSLTYSGFDCQNLGYYGFRFCKFLNFLVYCLVFLLVNYVFCHSPLPMYWVEKIIKDPSDPWNYMKCTTVFGIGVFISLPNFPAFVKSFRN